MKFRNTKTSRMPGDTRKRKEPGFMRTILAANLVALLNYHYRDIDRMTNRQHELAKRTGLSPSSIDRYCKAQQGASIDIIELIATAFDLSPYHLLLPNLEVENPQIVEGAMAGERLMYMKFMRNAREKSSSRKLQNK